MAKKLNKILLFVLLAYTTLNITITSGYVHTYLVDEVEFEDAWYADLDGDGYEDDIGYKLKIELECNEYHDFDYSYYENGIEYEYDDYNDYYDDDEDYDDYERRGCSKYELKTEGAIYYLRVELVIPSGIHYSYDIDRIAYKDDFKLELHLINHATESGWYWGYVTGLDSNHYPITETDSIYFDPPGGGGGNELIN